MNHVEFDDDWVARDRAEGIAAVTGLLVATVLSLLLFWLPLAAYVGWRIAEWVTA